MNLLAYTNCQGIEITSNLKRSGEFNKNFSCIDLFHPHWYWGEPDKLPVDLLRSCDVFIYQPFSIRRGIYNTYEESGVMKYLPSNCKKIAFPSLYLDIFPVYKEGNYIKGLTQIRDLIKMGYTKEKIVNMFFNMELNFDLKRRFNYCIDFMRQKEEVCDIKASEFIEKNIGKKRLFDTRNHPTEILHGFITNEIFKILEIDFQIDLEKMERVVVNGADNALAYSSYMSKELNMGYEIHETMNDNYMESKYIDSTYYLKLICDYIDSPDSYNLLEPFKTVYS